MTVKRSLLYGCNAVSFGSEKDIAMMTKVATVSRHDGPRFPYVIGNTVTALIEKQNRPRSMIAYVRLWVYRTTNVVDFQG